ncbi:MAG: GAF domain-containing protein [Comamonadaceae bacterium]|nr:MAG: GAF domain-containing protein [Comamonadaceae bacterium]
MNLAYPAPTLDNCDREPIHIPGAIQSHGALLALDAAGMVRAASRNAQEMLGLDAQIGRPLPADWLQADARLGEAIAEGLAALAGTSELPMPLECTLQGHAFDVVQHLSAQGLIVEFERRQHSSDELAGFAFQAHRVMEKLRRPRGSIDDLLQLATQELHALTGFDRVMAYRFRPDGSGDVVAESCVPALDPYLGRRYPASDIPAQARRLYVVNTLRLIADISSTTVPLQQDLPEPLDLSASLLRSVSPIHIEYLSNMGVGASMSISIVINDQLWGLLACHHMGPRQVPYSVRMACDVIAQILSAKVQSALARKQAERQQQVSTLRMGIMESVLHADDEFGALCHFAKPLAEAVNAEGIVVAERGKLCREGPVSEESAEALVQWLNATQPPQGHAIYQTHALPLEAPRLVQAVSPWCGVLALPLDRAHASWLIFLRLEQIETIHWGGRPEKEVRPGPLGPRLTPRGSFDLWKETVRATSEHWSAEDRQIAQTLLDELVRAQNARHAELNRARNQLMAILGHDLRDPLHSISMAARVLEKTDAADSRTGKLGQRIQSTSNRMQRLVTQVMDMSRLQGKMGLDLHKGDVDLVPLLADLLDEARTAHPGIVLQVQTPDTLRVQGDADRIAQVVANLVSNARHHGQLGQPIDVRAFSTALGHVIEVRNVAPPIAADVAAELFKPFKQTSLGNARNRTGMGLGLYIAHQIALGHGGSIDYAYAEPHVVFSMTLPLSQA